MLANGGHSRPPGARLYPPLIAPKPKTRIISPAIAGKSAEHPQLQAVNLTPPHELPQRIAAMRWNQSGPERPGPTRSGPLNPQRAAAVIATPTPTSDSARIRRSQPTLAVISRSQSSA